MKKNQWAKLAVTVVVLLATIQLATPIQAQTATTPSNTASNSGIPLDSLGIAHYVPYGDASQLKDGEVFSHADMDYVLSSGAYDKSIVGVYTSQPAMTFEPELTAGQIPIVTSGVVGVLVNTSNGPIKKGDNITSSDTPGIGMKATKSGFILGVAQDDFDGSKGNPGTVPVLLNVIFAYGKDTPDSQKIASNLLTVVSASRLAAIEDPALALRTLVAALLVLGSIVVSFLTFARVAQKGIDALGRNPMASRMIGVGIIMNLTISVLILVAGIVSAYFVIRFQ